MEWLQVIFRLGLGWAALVLAQKRGRDGILWCLLTAFLFFPILILVFLPPIKKKGTPPKSKQEEDHFSGQTVEVKPLSEEMGSQKGARLSFEKQSWYQLDKERKSEGPFLFDEMQRRFWEGDLTADSFVWIPEWKEWQKVGAVPGLLKALSK